MQSADHTTLRHYDQDVAQLFIGNYGEAIRAASSLAVSLRRTARLFPLTGEGLLELNEENKERLDAFRVRYASLQDILANKLFRTLLILEEESAMSMLDVLNDMEKRGIVDSYSVWKRLRELRNVFMHDYAHEDDLKASALTEAYGKAPELLQLLNRLRTYVIQHVGLAAAYLPEVPQCD